MLFFKSKHVLGRLHLFAQTSRAHPTEAFNNKKGGKGKVNIVFISITAIIIVIIISQNAEGHQ